MIRYLIALLIIIHGLAHLSGFLAAFTNLEVGYTKKPWVFSSQVTLRSPGGKVFGVLWLAAMLGLVASGLGILIQKPCWTDVLPAASALSLVVILPWIRTVPPGAIAGAALDGIILITLFTPLRNQLIRLLV